MTASAPARSRKPKAASPSRPTPIRSPARTGRRVGKVEMTGGAPEPPDGVVVTVTSSLRPAPVYVSSPGYAGAGRATRSRSCPKPSPTRQRTITPVTGEAVVRPGITVCTPVQEPKHPIVPSETVRSLPIVVAASPGDAATASASAATATAATPRVRATTSDLVEKRMTFPFWSGRLPSRTSEQYLGLPGQVNGGG